MEKTNRADSSTGVDPPPFDPLAPAVPISFPLKTLDELESRSYFKSFHFPFNQTTVKLPTAENGPLPQRPRNLVCHDMAGGYTDDRFVQGGANADAYAIWHWYLIDVFIYFSHTLVTLPPPCWTNTAHRHGVRVLGTFIMEEGDVVPKPANQLLATKASAQMYAERLTELAVTLGFDGWLINMEVSLDDPGQVPILEEFVSHLSQTMHSSLPGSLVIWYDSVTVDGFVDYQNQLNDRNKAFFDRCDGILANYQWEENYVKQSADVAGSRKLDVYMGIDVFGRGTFGGGGWTTNVALDVLKKNNVSAALFAPGWVYETKQPPDFQTAQNRWWGLVEKSWGIVKNYPKVLPFYSNFDQGRGYHISVDGVQVFGSPWNNISSQSFQPFIEYPGESTPQPIQVTVNFKEASYSGGGNITFRGTLGDTAEFSARLFEGELLLGNSPVHFTYSVRSSGNSLLGLALVTSTTTEKSYVLLAASGDISLTMNQFSTQFTKVIMPQRVTKLEAEPGWVMQESSLQMNGHVLKEIRAVCYRPKSHSPGPSEYYTILGDIKITSSGETPNFPPSTSWSVDGQFVSWTSGPNGLKHVNVKITWKQKNGDADIFTRYNIYVNKLTSISSGNHSGILEGAQDFLGVAAVNSFYVSNLEVPSGTSSLKFIIQVCGLDGACQKLEDSPFFLLQVPGPKYRNDECLHSQCGRKLTIMVSETVDNLRKLFYCCPIHGFSHECNLNAEVGHKGYSGHISDAKLEDYNILQRYLQIKDGLKVKRKETQGESLVVYLLLIVILLVLVIYCICLFWLLQ